MSRTLSTNNGSVESLKASARCGCRPKAELRDLMSQADDPTDERKRLLSALIEGPAILVIDNVERPLQ